MQKITNSPAWQNLLAHRQKIAKLKIREQFDQDPERFTKFSLTAANLFLDYSKNKITAETIELLCKLAEAAELPSQIEAMFSGQIINATENRAVLHTALRNPDRHATLEINHQNIFQQIREVLARIKKCSDSIRGAHWKGYSGHPINSIVNIGIGGSDLGPAMAIQALTPYTANNLKYYFVSNIDGAMISETLSALNPETTLFIVASKTFTTQETLGNAVAAKEWLLNQAGKTPDITKHHFIAVTAKPERAEEFGIAADNIFPFWDWVGGRYSLWSAIGLIVAIAIGMDNFEQLLAGANTIDNHFRQAPLHKNMPVILALIGIWNLNFWQNPTQAIIPYSQNLHLLPAYLQQLEMESNGKHVQIDGSQVETTTAPIIWGSSGTNGQHAFHQLLMQGTQTVPVDFILTLQTHYPIGDHQLLLFANCLAQSQALMQGKFEPEIINELIASGLTAEQAKKLAPHKVVFGNIPSNTILLPKLTPASLGALLALYEHQVFVQGVIWQINSFDQWGVELGKHLTNSIIPRLQQVTNNDDLDGSTKGLIDHYNSVRYFNDNAQL